MNPFIQASIEACHEISLLIQEGNQALFSLHQQGFGGDISSEIDLKAEAICFRHLSHHGSIFSEESGWMSPESSTNIFLDPIDGSDNFLSYFPYYGVSIARVCEGVTTEAVVCNLVSGEIFIRTPQEYYRTSLSPKGTKREIITNRSSKIGLFEKSSEHPLLIAKLMEKRLKFRSPGALALSLAYAPYVKYVLFLGTMRPYDIQAGLYLSSHLLVHNDERYILISSDKEIFEHIRMIVEKEYF